MDGGGRGMAWFGQLSQKVTLLCWPKLHSVYYISFLGGSLDWCPHHAIWSFLPSGMMSHLGGMMSQVGGMMLPMA